MPKKATKKKPPAPRKRPVKKKPAAGPATAMVPLADLSELDGNPRAHDQENVAAIVASLESFGQVEPLVVRKATMEVIGGNGRVAAMRLLEWTEANCRLLEISADKAKALAIALNRTAEMAAWDDGRLGRYLEDLAADGIDEAGELRDLFGAMRMEELVGGIEEEPATEDAPLPETFEVVVSCEDEADQKALYERMTEEGRECRCR